MKVLVVGGTGLIGSHTARLLAEQGDNVVVAGRSAPEAPTLVDDLEFLPGDYAAGDFTAERLRGFDAVVMAAGNDVRHVSEDTDVTAFWDRMQSGGVPALAEAARAAGVGRFVQVGSCYHMVRPDWAEINSYVRARREADDRARALASEDFAVVTINPPPIVGMIPGVATRRYHQLFSWARGEEPGVRRGPLVAPPGGTNFMTVRSLAESVDGALRRGVSGTAYLVGDENFSYADYFQAVVDAAGGTGTVEVVDAEHWFLPDRMIVPGRSAMFSYEPDPEAAALLGYRRNDVRPMLAEMVAQAAAAFSAGQN